MTDAAPIDGPDPLQHHTARARRTARLNAVQALYQMEISGQGLDYVVENFTHQGSLGEPDNQETLCDQVLFRTLVAAAVAHQSTTDTLAAAALRQDWPLASLDPTLRAIFRVATAELHDRQRPPRIVIRDYLDIASAFFPQGKEVGFVNGILDTLAHHLRPDAFNHDPA